MQISTKDFVDIVRERPVLWQKSHPDFQHRELRQALLAEVSEISGSTVNDCAKKLKGLKDTMRAQVAKLPKTKAGSPDFSAISQVITWPYFKMLMFMKDEFTGRRGTAGRNSDDESDKNITTNNKNNNNNHNKRVVKYEIEEDNSTTVQIADSFSMNDADDVFEDRDMINQNNSFDDPSLLPPKQKKNCVMDSSSKASIYKPRMISIHDEYDAFAADIANDLRKIDSPLKLMQTKVAIRRTVEEAVFGDLCVTSSQNM